VGLGRAPFPKSGRPVREDDLKKLQGRWVRLDSRGHVNPICMLTIQGNRMQFPNPNEAWIITLDTTKTPRRIDRLKVGQQKDVRVGIYRLEGDTFTFCLGDGPADKDRPPGLEADKRGDACVFVDKRLP